MQELDNPGMEKFLNKSDAGYRTNQLIELGWTVKCYRGHRMWIVRYWK